MSRELELQEFISRNDLEAGKVWHNPDKSTITAYRGDSHRVLYVLDYGERRGWDILGTVSDVNNTEQTLIAARDYLYQA